jgi:hypothetical protein
MELKGRRVRLRAHPELGVFEVHTITESEGLPILRIVNDHGRTYEVARKEIQLERER